MKFEINTGTLLIGLAVFLVGVFFKPAVFVLRDKAVWWYIKKYLITEILFNDLRSYAGKCAIFEHNFKETYSVTYNDDGVQYYIIKNNESIPITKEQYGNYSERVDTLGREIRTMKMEYAQIASRYNSLVKHYSQDGSNPVSEYLEKELDKQRVLVRGKRTVLEKYVIENQGKKLDDTVQT